jgi:transposase-like protein/IS1 family transposase
MIVITCQHPARHKHGKNKCGNQRYKCADCGATFVDESGPLGDMRVDMKTATLALNLMLEGMSIRSVQRITGLCRQTLADLIILVGENCARLLESKVKGVEVNDIQVDEIWGFIGMKEKTRVLRGKSPVEFGDTWTFLAIERNSKLILAHQVGQRDSDTCWALMLKLKAAIGTGRFQLTTDGLAAYKSNVPYAFGMQVDFAQLIKVYSSTQDTTRYSPASIISTEKLPMFGEPDDDSICTSHIERFNLTYRMSLRRYTRLTNAHSKSLRHHTAMQALFVAWYNFGRKHETLKGKTPAMVSRLSDHVWTIKELIEKAGEV